MSARPAFSTVEGSGGLVATGLGKRYKKRPVVRNVSISVKRGEAVVRILSCFLPVKSPWLNPIEPHWVHAKRKVVEPDRLLSAHELETRLGDYFGCEPEPHLIIPQKAA